jgi:hypothetical protein
MFRLIAITFSMVFFTTSCSGLQKASRTKVVEADAPMIMSPFAPEDDEACTEIKRFNCSYENSLNMFKSEQDQCMEQALPEANAVNADYVYVDLPSTSVGGVNTSSTVAVMYACANLSE